MSDVKAKMHKILFPLGLCPRARWGAYSAPQNPLAVFKGLLLMGRGNGRGGEGKGKIRGKGKEGKRGGKGRA